MILLSRLVMLIAVVILLVFCMSNLEPITVKMVGWESPQMPLFLILMFVFFFGFFLALFWQALRGVTRKKESRPTTATAPVPEPKPEKSPRRWGRKNEKEPKVAEEQDSESVEAGDTVTDKSDDVSAIEKEK